MAAGKYTFVIEQGATTSFEIQYKDGNGNPIDLSRYHARMQIRPTWGSSTLIASLSSSLDADGTGLNMSGSAGNVSPVSGTIGVYISAASSSLFDFSEAKYDLEIVSGSTVTRILEGNVKLSKEITV